MVESLGCGVEVFCTWEVWELGTLQKPQGPFPALPSRIAVAPNMGSVESPATQWSTGLPRNPSISTVLFKLWGFEVVGLGFVSRPVRPSTRNPFVVTLSSLLRFVLCEPPPGRT